MRLAGFAKLRNEIARGNLYRVLANLEATCDCGVVLDDASSDGTAEVLQKWAAQRGWIFMRTQPADQDFARELEVKQRMLMALHDQAREVRGIDWILWLDGDETWDAKGTRELRAWLETAAAAHPEWPGIRAHYTQLWRNASWARTDGGFDDGDFVKLFRYRPDLSFSTQTGTHRQQFPIQIQYGACGISPFELVHWGNASSKALQFKAHQYTGGLGGVDRHLAFGHTQSESLATGVGFDQAKWSEPRPTYRRVDPGTLPAVVAGETRRTSAQEPAPFSMPEIRRIRAMGNLRGLKGWFTVVVPAFNRAHTLPRALQSLLAQRYEQWIAVVIDDGSTDETPDLMADWQERDPRIFFCRFQENRGGVAVNNVGMAMAVEQAEFFSRLGSDDWWGPSKLETDAAALAQHEAVFGPFRVWRHDAPAELCAGQWGASTKTASERLRAGEFLASWANVALRTSVLQRVRERYGNFVDPRLHSMEDMLFNCRVARLGVEWTWRPGEPEEAFWRCLENVGADPSASASANAVRTANDHALTMQILREEAGR